MPPATMTRANVHHFNDLDLSVLAGRMEEEGAKLDATEYAVETNSGTYSAAEAQRARGTGEPRYSDWTIYMTVGGRRRVVGEIDGAPGRAIKRYERHAADRKRLDAIRADLRIIRDEQNRRYPRDDR